MAASNLNRVVLTANLTKDPDLRSTPGGTSVCFLRGVGASTRPAALAAIAGLIGESAGRRLRAGTIRVDNGFFTGWQRRSNIPRAGRPYARAMHNQPKTSATLSPLFIEEERFLALAPTGLAAASRALPFAYEADSLPVAESSALPSGLSEVMEALADGGG
ncbi:MAG TPA: hypothetical protein VE780_15260 [Thermoleophilaceae bacterium]|nr:hypothetical protein [Thermoleophilaceae bacterium]